MSSARLRAALGLLTLLGAGRAEAQAAQDDTSWSLRPGTPPTGAPATGAPPRVAPPVYQAGSDGQPAPPPQPRRWACPLPSLGYLAHLGVGGTTASEGPRYLVIDVRVGILCVRNRDGDERRAGLRLVPEVGYHYLWPGSEPDPPTPSVHLGSVGLGVGFGHRWASIGGVARLLAGTSADGMVVGLRHGLLLRGLYDSVALEASHVALLLPGGWRNELYGGISVNVLLLALLFGQR